MFQYNSEAFVAAINWEIFYETNFSYIFAFQDYKQSDGELYKSVDGNASVAQRLWCESAERCKK